jgi:hypothetical protein
MAQLLSKNRILMAACLLAMCASFSGCRSLGFYSPVYSRQEVQSLLGKNSDELTSFANAWFQNHRDDEMRYDERHGGNLTLTGYARNGTGIPSPSATSTSGAEISELQKFAARMKIEDVSVLRVSNQTESWYVRISFQGGGKWPYGLLYIPGGEPMNMLNDANGGPGPGFSKVTPLQGRWLYFESK